jgi:FkbM family methyltransferase
MLGGRSPSFVLRQVAEPENYRAVMRMTSTVVHPADFAGRYFMGRGEYPATCEVRTPAGVIAPTVFSHHDVITINEIFCRLDYRLPAAARTVVDIGSNIGLSALYFLTRSAEVRCHLYEPDPRNVSRLRGNLSSYGDRYVLTEAAVADRSGSVLFGREPTGRYGGIGSRHGDQIEVECLHVDEVLSRVLELEGRIDMLKIDTEGLENQTVNAIDRDLLAHVGVLCFETRTPINPAPEHFLLQHSTDTARLTNRSATSTHGIAGSRSARVGVKPL